MRMVKKPGEMSASITRINNSASVGHTNLWPSNRADPCETPATGPAKERPAAPAWEAADRAGEEGVSVVLFMRPQSS